MKIKQKGKEGANQHGRVGLQLELTGAPGTHTLDRLT